MLKYLYKSPLFISVVVAVITLLVFWRVLSADFVMWDDHIIIINNPNIQGQLSFAHIGEIFSDIDSMMRYNPLTLLSWNITYHFWKLDPFWYHVVNWMLHGASSALVFLVLRKLLLLGLFRQKKTNAESGWITISAAVGALLWSLHPLRVEPVAWCTDRTYCQSLFFLLLSLLCYLKSAEPNITTKRHYLFLATSVVLYIVSLLSYAIGTTFFIILLILDVYLLRTIGGTAIWWKSASVRRILLEKVPFVVSALGIAVVTVCIRIASAGIWQKPVSLHEFGLFERFMQAMYIWAYYIWRPLYPINLAPVYSTLFSFDPLSLPFVASAIGVIGTIVLLILLRRRWPLALMLAICYLALLVPVLGIWEHPHYPADRYSLIVSMCFSVILTFFLANPKTKKPARYGVFFLSITVIASLGILSYRQTRVWNNSVSLFEHTIRTLADDPYSADIHYRLGIFLYDRGQNSEAMEHFQKTLEMYPNFISAYGYIASIYADQKEFDKAAMCLQKALSIEPNSTDLHYVLGRVYLFKQQPDKTILHWEKAMELKPDSVVIMSELAELLATYPDANFRNPQKAIRIAKRCCELTEYKNPSLLNILATALASSNRFAEARTLAQRALQITRSTGEKELTEKILYRLNFYKANQPYINYPPVTEPNRPNKK